MHRLLASSVGTCGALMHATAITEESAGDVTPTSARSQSSHGDGERLHFPRTTVLNCGCARPQFSRH
jgi:hypothetical protein